MNKTALALLHKIDEADPQGPMASIAGVQAIAFYHSPSYTFLLQRAEDRTWTADMTRQVPGKTASVVCGHADGVAGPDNESREAAPEE